MKRSLFPIPIPIALLAGCAGNDLPSGSYLDHDRALGVRIEVEGDPSRASPIPGEVVTARWIVAGPDPTPSVEWTLGACTGTATGCDSDPFAVESGFSRAPQISVTVPETGLLRIGGEIAGTKVMASVPIATGNLNPSLAGAALMLADAPWEDADCIELSAASQNIELTLALPADAREAGDDALQVSHFTSVGSFERQFSVLDGDATSLRVDWVPPEDAMSEPVTAQFVIVLRDGRGGLDAITRQACIVP